MELKAKKNTIKGHIICRKKILKSFNYQGYTCKFKAIIPTKHIKKTHHIVSFNDYF